MSLYLPPELPRRRRNIQSVAIRENHIDEPNQSVLSGRRSPPESEAEPKLQINTAIVCRAESAATEIYAPTRQTEGLAERR